MKSRAEVVRAFRQHSLHDDTVHAVRILPSTSRRRESRIEIDLTEYVSDKPRQLILTGCVAMAFSADFDVLTFNAFANVGYLEADTSTEAVRRLIEAQMPHRNLEYDPPGTDSDPTVARLKKAAELVLFRVRFFGGTLEVAARGFKLSRPRLSARVGRSAAAASAEEVRPSGDPPKATVVSI